MRVAVLKLGYAPVAAMNITYGVGSVWESPGTRGYSHLAEHLMFRGSKNFGPGEYWRVVQCNGGIANAYTSRDITVYYSIVPLKGLATLLELEADRMFDCSLRAEDVISERAVILEEELMTERDDPDGCLDALLYSTALGSHP